MTDQCPFLLRNHPSWRATTTLLLYVYARLRTTPPPCSQRTRTTAPFLRTALLCRYLRCPSHPALSPPRFPEREEDQEKSARLKEEKRSEVEWRKDFQDTSRLLFFSLRFRQVFTPSSVSLFTDISTSCLFAEFSSHSFYAYSFLQEYHESSIRWIYSR